MSLQDEEVARTIQEKEDHKYMKEKHREVMDAKLGMFTYTSVVFALSCAPGMGGATAHQVSIEEQRRMLKQKQQREHEAKLSEQLIRRMQLEESPPERDEDDITNDEVSFVQN